MEAYQGCLLWNCIFFTILGRKRLEFYIISYSGNQRLNVHVQVAEPEEKQN